MKLQESMSLTEDMSSRFTGKTRFTVSNERRVHFGGTTKATYNPSALSGKFTILSENLSVDAPFYIGGSLPDTHPYLQLPKFVCYPEALSGKLEENQESIKLLRKGGLVKNQKREVESRIRANKTALLAYRKSLGILTHLGLDMDPSNPDENEESIRKISSAALRIQRSFRSWKESKDQQAIEDNSNS